MSRFFSYNIAILLVFCLVALTRGGHTSDEERKVYIVYLGKVVETDQSPSSNHFRMLRKIVDSRFVRQSLVRSYTRSFNGFAAYLTAQEQEMLANHEEVVSIFPSTTLYTQTTRSWDFMGFSQSVRRSPTVESDIIIGVIDGGIWPESDSFNDEGFSPPPQKWKGACNGGKNFTCNNKLIGARYYGSSPDDSARDYDGHGSHTASTAAGNYVEDASFYDIAKGTARGGVPSARIAAYKVCHKGGCSTEGILAAFDDAIADGVDVITISIGARSPGPLIRDGIAIGALHASMQGILVVQAAGNSVSKYKIMSTAPWILSVAAGATDREIITRVALGNGTVLSGKSVNAIKLSESSLPLVYGKEVSLRCSADDAGECQRGCLDKSLVKGKIVLCRTNGIDEAFKAGAAGAVIPYETNVSFVRPLPASGLKHREFTVAIGYYNSTRYPKVNILTSETVRNPDAPTVAGFSSKGPNSIIPDILKPDVTAPGVEILAAFSPLASPSKNPDDHRAVNYSIMSGTSMACPHVTGAAVYVKSFHPNWSASAIKSALMTTAWKMDPRKDPLAEFAYGAGHIDPVKAVDPGLVYETSPDDHIKLLCSLGNETAALARMFQENITCGAQTALLPKDLNYPSMTSRINSSNGITFTETFTRTVTNVGHGSSTYKVTTSTSPNYKIKVKPEALTFGVVNEKKSFEVNINGNIEGKMVSASLEWSDGVHRVRSPIVIYADNL